MNECKNCVYSDVYMFDFPCMDCKTSGPDYFEQKNEEPERSILLNEGDVLSFANKLIVLANTLLDALPEPEEDEEDVIAEDPNQNVCVDYESVFPPLDDALYCDDCPGNSSCEAYMGSPAVEEEREVSFANLGYQVGNLVAEKNKAYGDSFAKCGDFLKLLYPEGIQPGQYNDMLGLVRIFDKQMRIATDPVAFNEEPWKDIAGYGLLGMKMNMEK